MSTPGSGPASAPVEYVELRVHGVHGTTPASMLGIDDTAVTQVSGDGLTGVFRAKAGTNLPERDLTGRPISVEAYSWGALTSGVQGVLGWLKRALWLILLPFALANLAYWARLGLGTESGVARWGARATRLGALLLTVFMVLTPSLLAIDVVSWQCYRGDSPGCSVPGVFDFMAGLGAARRLAVGCLVPIAVVGVLWALSRTTLSRYEECSSDPLPAHGGDVLRHRALWQGATRTRQLQQAHLAVALLVVVAFSGIHVLVVDLEGTPPLVWLTVLLGFGLAGLAIGWSLVLHPDDVDFFDEHTSWIVVRRRQLPARSQIFLRNELPRWLLAAAVGVTALHLIVLLTLDDALDEGRDFVGHNLWFISVFVALTAVHLSIFTGGRMRTRWAIGVVLLVFALAGLALAIHLHAAWLPDSRVAAWVGFGVLAALIAWLLVWHYRSGERHRAEAWNGAGASVLLAAAAWVGLLFTTGVVTVAADYLNGSDHAVDDLVSRSSVRARVAAEAYQGDPKAPSGYLAAGDVVAKNAIVTVAEGRVRILAGSVRMESLYQPSEASTGPQADLARALDSTRVRGGTLALPGDSVGIEDSCVRAADATDRTCSAEDADFVPAGSLPAKGGRLDLGGDGRTITLTVTKPPQMPLVIPQVLIWSPVIQLLWLVATLLFAAWATVRVRRTYADVSARLLADTDIPERDRASSEQARRSAVLLHRAERLLDTVGAITAVLALGLIALSATGRPPWDVWAWTSHVATLAMYVVAGLGLGLIYLASRLRRSVDARRGVGVLWDLTTFWPRAAHPLAPPCYAERVVPELHTRVRWALHGPSGGAENVVILSGHSQGSAILCALVSRLSRSELARVRVITYGSQIRAFYGRVFPRVFGPEAIGYVPTSGPTLLGRAFPDAGTSEPPPTAYVVPTGPADSWSDQPLLARVYLAGGAWVNLFRRTDPLGFRVFSDTDEAPDVVVPEVPVARRGDPGPEVLTHGGYQHTPAYRRQVAAWTGEPFVEDPPGTDGVPPLPAM